MRHDLQLDRPVSASCNSLFKTLPSRLRPFGLQFNAIFAILLLLILVTCSQFDLFLLSFISAGSSYSSSKNPSLLIWSKRVYPAVLLKNFICIYVIYIF